MRRIGFLVALAAGVAPAAAQGNRAAVDLSAVFRPKLDVMIPMRDGVTLHTEIYVPVRSQGPAPIMLERTPYYANPGERPHSSRLQLYSEFFDDGYIFVLQDIRGRYRSNGRYVTLRPPRSSPDPDATDESTDFYDTIDWLVKHVPDNNGRVGTLGISYGGYLATRAMIDPHPALVAVSPQATCADMFVGDDFHHNGAFRLHYSFVAAAALETPRSYSSYWDRYDLYEWFLALGPLSAVNRYYFNGQSPLWNGFVSHPNQDEYWEREVCGVLPFLHEVTVPALHVLGWYDAEDFYGALRVYQQLERSDRGNRNFLVIGPWTHGGWTFDEEGRTVSQVDAGSATARFFREKIHAAWFRRWLRGDSAIRFPEAIVFQTGSNRWEAHDRWPPEGTEQRSVYLEPTGRVGFAAPRGDDRTNHMSWRSDPDRPVPFQARPVRYPERWAEWQAEDQRFDGGRPDVVVFESDPLAEDLTVAGEIGVELFASTTGIDADWIVKLIDVYPEGPAGSGAEPAMAGYRLMVAGEVFRARFRSSFSRPEPVVPDSIVEYAFSLRDRSHRFRKGHRIMVQVQSTWFPLIDRNPQTWVPNIFEARPADFQPATQTVYFSARHPSRVVLPVVIRSAGRPFP